MTRILTAIILLSLVLTPFAAAQTSTLPFVIRAQQGSTITISPDGGTVNMTADYLGASSAALITVTYKGTSSATINNVDLSGNTDISISGGLSLPVVLRPDDVFALTLRYAPTTSARINAALVFSYTEGRTNSRFTQNITGTAPEFAFSYIPQGGNATPVGAGGTVQFPATAINATSSATIVVTNRGTAAGVVSGVTLSGAPTLAAVGFPLPNTSVDAGKDLRFSVNFTPKALETSQGTVTVQLLSGAVAFNLAGPASGPAFTYEVLQADGAQGIAAGGAIPMPDAVLGDKSSVVLRIKNTGNADGTIGAINISGTGFQIPDMPLVPLALPQGGAVTMTIVFTPAQPGRATGRLRIGSDTFDVAGSGLGATLSYAYAIGDTTTTVQNNGSVFFTPAAVGRAVSVKFLMTNTGTAPTTVNSISVAASNTMFTLADLPGLPLTIAAGATTPFTVQFTPTVTGTTTATLKVDALTFTLSGSANAPDPLPSYKFDAPTGPQDPMQQPAVGLTLSQAYPLQITGTLTLTFNSDVFSNDPSVQFAVGGRTVTFVIPANTTKAVFPQGASQIKVQTGTVAGTITLTPSFSTDTGISLTPQNPPALNIVVPQSAPRLLGVEVSAKTSNTFTLLIRGYSTSRSVTQMDFNFGTASTENVSITKMSLPVEANFVSWFQNSTSQQYGSLFTATVPFTLTGDVTKVSQQIEAIQSVTVTLTNKSGASSPVTVSLK